MLRILNIYKSFPYQADPVLSNIDLTIKKGEFCIILGGNGSGKTTLLKTILGEYQPDSGNIYLGQKCITDLPPYMRAKYISSVVQDVSRGTVADMTLLENITLSLLRGKRSNLCFYKNSEQKIIKIIKEMELGLEKYINTKMEHLSGGQKQTIATLMGMLSDAELLLLDEHTSALDPKTQKLLMSYTNRKVQELGLTTLMVTHNVEDAVKYGDRLVMLHHGRVVMDVKGKAKAELSKENVLQLYHNIEDKEGL